MNKDIYLREMDMEATRGHIRYLKPYLDCIRRCVSQQNSPVLEIGIGTGLSSVYLEQSGLINVFGIDIDEDIVEHFNTKTKPQFNSNVQVIEADAFDLAELKQDLKYIECIHHQGLLEHFSVLEIIEMLDHHTQMSNGVVVFAVPLDTHEDESEYDPDEIRWPIEKWLEIIRPRYRFFEYGAFGFDHKHDQAYFVISGK